MSAIATPLRPFGRKEPPAPLPDAKSSYERPLKRELANRLYALCLAYFFVTWFTLFITTLNLSKGPPMGFFGHLLVTTLFAGVSVLLGGLPPLFLRGRSVSEKHVPLPRISEMFMAMTSHQHSWRSLSVFAGSGFTLTVTYIAWLKIVEWEDPRLSILVPTRRIPFRLNERFIYLAMFNSGLGIIFSLRDLIRYRRIVRWPFREQWLAVSPSTSSMAFYCFLSLLNKKSFASTFLITIMHTLSFPVWYHVGRAFLLPVLRKLPLLYIWTRPLLHAFGRTWAVDVPWSRLLSLGLRTTFGWELVESAFDYWVTKPISVAPHVPTPNVALVAGLHSKERYFKYHAYLELAALACDASSDAASRRASIFTDSKTSPTLWNAITRELLFTLGQDYQTLIRRGKPLIVPVNSPPVPPAPRTPKTPAPTALLRQPVLKSSSPSKFDTLASDGLVTQTINSISVPSIFLPSPKSTPKLAQAKVAGKATEVVKKMAPVAQKARMSKKAMFLEICDWMERRLPRKWKMREWWTNVSAERQANASLPEATLDTIAIDALSHFVAASLKEDTLGAVQRDIPRILEALLSFLGEAESYKAELEKNMPANAENMMKDIAFKDTAQAVGIVMPVIQSLREGITLIVKTFDDRLGAYKFPPPTAKRLQTFLDYL